MLGLVPPGVEFTNGDQAGVRLKTKSGAGGIAVAT